MRRYFNHIVTFTFLAFNIMHFFLDATLVGPVGLFVFAVLNFSVFRSRGYEQARTEPGT